MKKIIFLYCIFCCLSIHSQSNIDKKKLYKKIDTLSILLQKNKLQEAEFIINEIQTKMMSQDLNTKLDLAFKLALFYIHTGSEDKAKIVLLKYLPDIKKSNNYELKGKIYERLCSFGANDFDIPFATKYYELAKENYSKCSNASLQIPLDLQLYHMYFSLKEYDTAIQILTNCYKKSIQLKDKGGIIKCMGHFVDYYDTTKNYKRALFYAKKGIEIAKGNFKNARPYFLEDCAKVYMNLKQYESAIFYFKKANQAVAEDTSAFRDFKEFKLNKIGAELYATIKDKKNALKYLNRANSSHLINELNVESDHLFFRATIYEKVGNYDLALKNINTYLKLKDEIDKKEANRYLMKYNSLYQSIEKEKKIYALQKENQEKKNLLYKGELKRNTIILSFSILFLFTIFSLLLWNYFKTKKIISAQENLRFQSVIEAQEVERKRIAKDLHDGLGQNICAIKMICSNILNTEKENSTKLLSIIDQTYNEIRNISHNMMPNTLIQLGLIPAIKEMISTVEVSNDLTFDFEHNFQNNVEEKVAISIYRIVQESISNIIKHAKATNVKIKLLTEKKNYVLTIKDNGIGSEDLSISNINNEFSDEMKKTGIGLKNILSRTIMIKGKIYIDSSPKNGTTLKIVF